MKELIRSLRMFVIMSLLTGIAYPIVITGIAHLEFRKEANGSLITFDKEIMGSSLIGQQFTTVGYFHGRPSALEKPYDAGNSGGSNSGPSNAKFLDLVGKRVLKVREENRIPRDVPVPADLVLASASGLDPHITPQAAMVQISRVARARRLTEEELQGLVERHIEPSLLRFMGEDRVNVLLLNLALDDLGRKHVRTGLPR